MAGIRLVAIDLDGTLVDGSNQITSRNRRSVTAALQRGITVIIATGRMFVSAAAIAAELNLTQGLPLITYNGALVQTWPDAQVWQHSPLPLETARSVVTWGEENGCYVQAYQDDCLFVPAAGAHAEAYSKHARVTYTVVGPLSQWLECPPTKLLLMPPLDQVETVQIHLLATFGEKLGVALSRDNFLEVVAPAVSKATGLAVVCERLGVLRTEVLALGDSWNDLEMLRWSGHSVAMAHAPAAVRKAATAVDYSVAEALERYELAG